MDGLKSYPIICPLLISFLEFIFIS